MSGMITCRGSLVLGSGCRACKRCFDELLKLSMELVDPEKCHYDHHGYCQSHNLHERPCPHEIMKEIFLDNGDRTGIMRG